MIIIFFLARLVKKKLHSGHHYIFHAKHENMASFDSLCQFNFAFATRAFIMDSDFLNLPQAVIFTSLIKST